MLTGKCFKVDPEVKMSKSGKEYQKITVEVEGLIESFAVEPGSVKVGDQCVIQLQRFYDEAEKKYFHYLKFVYRL